MTGQGKPGRPGRAAQAGEPAPVPPLAFDVRQTSGEGACVNLSCGRPAGVVVSVPTSGRVPLTWRLCAGCWLTVYGGLSGSPHRVVFDR